MSDGPGRQAVVEALTAQVAAELDALVAATSLARDEATHGESRPENKYDTRALEASYLAAGQGQRIEELTTLLMWFRNLDPAARPTRVDLAAVVSLEGEDGDTRWVFMAPTGGTSARVGELEVRTLSPSSGLGQALRGLQEDDAAEVHTPRETREWVVTAIF